MEMLENFDCSWKLYAEFSDWCEQFNHPISKVLQICEYVFFSFEKHKKYNEATEICFDGLDLYLNTAAQPDEDISKEYATRLVFHIIDVIKEQQWSDEVKLDIMRRLELILAYDISRLPKAGTEVCLIMFNYIKENFSEFLHTIKAAESFIEYIDEHDRGEYERKLSERKMKYVRTLKSSMYQRAQRDNPEENEYVIREISEYRNKLFQKLFTMEYTGGKPEVIRHIYKTIIKFCGIRGDLLYIDVMAHHFNSRYSHDETLNTYIEKNKHFFQKAKRVYRFQHMKEL